MELTELDRIEELEREAAALSAAERNAQAFHDPRRLTEAQRAFRNRLAVVGDIHDALAEARDIIKGVRDGLHGKGGNGAN